MLHDDTGDMVSEAGGDCAPCGALYKPDAWHESWELDRAVWMLVRQLSSGSCMYGGSTMVPRGLGRRTDAPGKGKKKADAADLLLY